jgi:hypothetical protein
MEDGTPVYQDDVIVVFSITKPSTPWTMPQFACMKQSPAACPSDATVVGAPASDSSSDSDSASDASSEAEAPEADDIENSKGKTVEVETDTSEDEESSSDGDDDDDDESDGNGLQNSKQEQLFQKWDALFSAVGPVPRVSHISKHTTKTGVQSGNSQCAATPFEAHISSTGLSGGKRALADQQAALRQTPKRVRSHAYAAYASNKGYTLSSSDKSAVLVARCATGTISKQAEGAFGFLVQVKGSGRCLLLSFAADVRAPSLH